MGMRRDRWSSSRGSFQDRAVHGSDKAVGTPLGKPQVQPGRSKNPKPLNLELELPTRSARHCRGRCLIADERGRPDRSQPIED